MAAGDDDTAEQYGTLCTQQSVAEPAARQRGNIGGTHIQTVDRGRGMVVQSEAAANVVDQVEDQQRTHAVETHALPHLDQEYGGNAGRMTEETAPERRGLWNCRAG